MDGLTVAPVRTSLHRTSVRFSWRDSLSAPAGAGEVGQRHSRDALALIVMIDNTPTKAV
jgi:hypothetical protein